MMDQTTKVVAVADVARIARRKSAVNAIVTAKAVEALQHKCIVYH